MSVRMTQEEVNRHLSKQLKLARNWTTERPLPNLEDKDERELQDRVGDYLRLKEIPFFRQRMDKRTTGTVGWPDFSFVIQSKACFFECKVQGRSLSADQEQLRQKLIEAGAKYAVIRSLGQAIDTVKMWRGEDIA